MNKEAKERKKKALLFPFTSPNLAIVNSKDLKECWSLYRLVQNDCTRCNRHAKCKYSVKGVYPNADPAKLYQTQLALLKLKQGIKQFIKEYER